MTTEKLMFFDKNQSKYIKLNVGGSLFMTSYNSLTKYDTMLKRMFEGEIKVELDSDGYVMIDRCGKHFGRILNYFRDGEIPLPFSANKIAEILAEAKYYCFEELKTYCENALKEYKMQESQNTFTLIINDEKEKNQIIKNSLKPVVVLSFGFPILKSRLGNEYFKKKEKNVEILEKLSKRYGAVIKFVQHVDVNSINEWEFYLKGSLHTRISIFGWRSDSDKCQEVDIQEAVFELLYYK